MAVQAVAAPPGLAVHTASKLSEAQLQELTARPRIDFSSILSTVGAAAPAVLALAARRAPPRRELYAPPPPAGGAHCG